MMGTRLGTHGVTLAVLLVLGTGVALGAPADPVTGSEVSATEGAENHTVVEFGWPESCPDEEVADLDEYFDGDIGDSDDEFHLDDADDDPPAPGCVLRTEGEDAAIHATPDGQSERLNYYPQRGDSISWNHYVHQLDPFTGTDPADFEFRFGLQDESNYYFVAIEADDEPYEFVVGEVSDGSVVEEDQVNIDGELTNQEFQTVAVDWTEETVAATFDSQAASIDSTAYDDGGIGFAREGTQGTIWSYTHLVDGVLADTAAHLQVTELDHPETIAPGEELTVEYSLENQGTQPVTESEVGLLVGPEPEDTDADVTVAAGETVTGELTYGADGYDDGDSVGFTVELADWNDSLGGGVDVAEPAEFVLTEVEAPETVDADEPFAVDYEVENVGGEADSAVTQLEVDAEDGFADIDDLSLDPGETTGGTLVYENVSEAYSGGDELDWTVGFAAFGDSESGTATVEDPAEFALAVDAPDAVTPVDELEVEYELTNEGGEPGTESAVELTVGDELADTDEEIELVPGESHQGTLVFEDIDEVFDGGEVAEWTVELATFDASTSGETEIVSGAEIAIESVDAPDEIGLNEDLTVEYTVENTGDLRGTESEIRLLVDGSLADLDADVMLPPDGSATGQLVYESVQTGFAPGEEIPLTVELVDFGHGVEAETDITEADEPGELYFTVDPPNPRAGDEMLLEAGHYNSSLYHYWLVDGQEVASGTTTTLTLTEPGTYNVTFVESEIPGGSPFGDEAERQVFDAVTQELELDEGELVVADTHLAGFDYAVFPELEDERPVELTIETTPDQEFENVFVEIDGVTTPLFPADSTGAERTYTGSVNIAGVDQDTEATVGIEAFGNSHTDSKQVDARDAPDWLSWVLENEAWFDPIQETENGYELILNDIFDTTVVVDSGTSPYWDEDINVTISAGGSFAIEPRGMTFAADVTGGAGIAGTHATADIEPQASFDYDLSLTEAELLTTVVLERDLFQQDVGLDPLYEYLPSPVAEQLPSCVVGAGASIQGELAHHTQFVDGLNPFDDLEEMALQGQPTLPIAGEATCGPVSASLSSAPTAQAAVLFEPGIEEFELLGAGAAADVTVQGQLAVDLWFFSGTEQVFWNLFSWEAVEGENPFLGASAYGTSPLAGEPPAPAAGGLERQPAGASTAPLAGVPTVDDGLTTETLSPATAADTTVRLTDRAFDDSEPALAPVDDEFALLWSGEPETDGERDPSDLRVRVGSGTDWGESIQITDTDHHETNPTLATDGGEGLAAWAQFEDADRDIDEMETEFFEEYEIAVAPATDLTGGDWGEPVSLTDGDAYEYDPAVVGAGDDEWLVVWDRNTAADLSDRAAEEVGYALVSTADGSVTVESEGTIEDARLPDVGVSDGEFTLAFHSPGAEPREGELVRGTLDPATGFDETASHDVSGFTDLAVAGDQVVWADGPAEDPALSTAAGAMSAAEAVPLAAETTRLSDLELAADEEGAVLTYQAHGAHSETIERDLFVQATDGGAWSDELQLARADLDLGTVSLSGADPVATTDGAVVPYVVSEPGVDSSDDLFLVERPYEPTHALDAEIDAPGDRSVGDAVTVEATVENVAVTTGDDPAVVEVTDGETVVETATVGPLGPGETASVELSPEIPATGELVVRVDGADPATDDGAFGQTATETLLTPALAPGEVAVDRVDESTSELTLTIENAGEVAADPMTVALREDGETVATATAPAVPATGSETVTLSYDPGALDPSTSETIALDTDDDLDDAALRRATESLWVGQPDVVVHDEVGYSETVSGTVVAELVLSNEGAVGAPVTVSALDDAETTADSEAVVGASEVWLPPAVGDTDEYVEVHVPLDGLSEGDAVQFDATPVERPDLDTSTTGIWDEVGPVTSGLALDPVAGGSPPADLDEDGLYRDIDGDGVVDTDDVTALFEHLDAPAVQHEAWALGFAGGDVRERVGVADAQALFDQTQGGEVPDGPTEAGQVTVSLDPAEESPGIGEETTVDVIVEGADEGIEALGFDLTVGESVTVTAVETGALATAEYSHAAVGEDGQRVTLAAAAGDSPLGAGEHTVATLTVEAETGGNATLDPVVEPFPDGVFASPADRYAVTTESATLEIVGPPALADGLDRPQDLDGDGTYEDVRGDGEFTIFDVQALFANLDTAAEYPSAFDFTGDGEVGITDVQALFEKLTD